MADLLLAGAIRVTAVSQYVADITGNIASGSNIISNVSVAGGIANLNELVLGLLLDNPNIPNTATITNVSGNQITISQNATGSQTGASITVNCPLHKYYISDGFVYEANSTFDATAVSVGWVTYASAGSYQGKILKFKVSDIVYQNGATLKCYIEYDAIGNLNADYPQAATWIICQPSDKLKLSSYLSAANYPELSYDGYLIETEEVRNIIDNLGVTGPQGLQGITGISIQGVTGAAGSVGIQGVTGSDGSAGIQGITGAAGSVGIQGVTGSDGSAGIQGVTGAAGSVGIQGVTGSDGSAGIQGITGSAGIQGITGAAGSVGMQGVTGAAGSVGMQGVTGAAGSVGIQGITGAAGIQGITGAAGIQGITGAAGSAGIQGATGLQGGVGVTGYGVTGLQGVTGPSSTSAGRIRSEVVSYQVVSDVPNARECWIKSSSTISGALSWSRSGTTCTIIDDNHGLSNGDCVVVRNVNEDYVYSSVTNVTANTFDVTVANTGASSGVDGAYVGAFSVSGVSAAGLTLVPPSNVSKVFDIQLIGIVFTSGLRASGGSVAIGLPTNIKTGGGSNNTLASNMFTGYAVSDPIAGTSVAATGFTVSATAVTITGMTGTSSRTVRISF
jgi:hypothetical protein